MRVGSRLWLNKKTIYYSSLIVDVSLRLHQKILIKCLLSQILDLIRENQVVIYQWQGLRLRQLISGQRNDVKENTDEAEASWSTERHKLEMTVVAQRWYRPCQFWPSPQQISHYLKFDCIYREGSFPPDIFSWSERCISLQLSLADTILLNSWNYINNN